MKDLPQALALLATCSFLNKQEISPRMKECHRPTPQEIASYAGWRGGYEPLPLTKKISPPPNFHPEIAKELGGIMNSRNNDNKEQPRGSPRVC